MVTTRDKKSVTLKDMNRGTVYDGPLVLMVNGQSASASEVLAACIQDYNRGLIVGSPTYGKATGQNIFPIESMTLEVPKKGQPGAGYVKITTQKLFRVTGKSAQGRGIVPDVLMPDIFSALNISERRYPFALKRDSIPMNPYFKPLTPLKSKELQALSSERLAKNPAFEELRKTISWLEQEMNRASKTEPLDPEKYFAMVQEQEEQQASADGVKSPDKIYEVSNGQTKEQQLAVDEYARELNDRWLDLLMSDLYLQETYQVLRDLVSFTKKP
jgi:carboxyl-terminal processing protease